MFITLLFIYNEGGHTYDNKDKKVLQLVEKNTEEIVIDQNVEEIKSDSAITSAFYLCKNVIKNVSFEENSKCKTLGNYLFSQTSIVAINFSNCNNLEVISKSCFLQCYSLTTVILPPNIITLSAGAFSKCSFLKRVKLPDSLEIIEDFDGTYSGVFIYCSRLTEIIISVKSNLKKIGSSSFQESKLTSFFFPKNVTSIGISSFSGCPIKNFTCDENNEIYKAEDNVIYNKEMTEIHFSHQG